MPRRRLVLPFLAVIAAALTPIALSNASAEVEPTSTEMRYGPIYLPPALNGTPVAVNVGLPDTPMPCKNCFLTGADIDMVYADGKTANLDTGVMLHHTVVFNSGRPDATCGPDTFLGKMGERFWAAGNERTSGDFPPGFGYHLGSDPVRGIAEIMNHSPQPKTVYIVTDMQHVPDDTPGMKAVTPVWMDVNNCNTSTYAVPAGPSNTVWTWTSNLTGRIVAAGGHVHDGGLRTVMANDTTGEHICTSHAGYGTKPEFAGTIESMSTCFQDRIGTVKKGEVLSLDTYYDSPVAQSDVMGIMLAYVHETEDLAAGSPPPPPTPTPANNTPPKEIGHGHGHNHGGHDH